MLKHRRLDRRFSKARQSPIQREAARVSPYPVAVASGVDYPKASSKSLEPERAQEAGRPDFSSSSAAIHEVHGRQEPQPPSVKEGNRAEWLHPGASREYRPLQGTEPSRPPGPTPPQFDL